MPLLDQLDASLTTEKILLGSSHYKRQMMIESLFLLGIASILFCVVWYLLVQIQKRLMKSIWEKQSLIDLTDDLHEKKLHLSASISASFHETWSWTQRTGVFWCSESFWKVFGYQDESDFPKAHFDVFRAHIDPENRGLLEAAVQQNIQDGTPFDLELCAKNQQGAYRWIRVQGKVVNNMTDHTNYVAGTVEDIHEHKLAKLQLDHQDKLLKKVGKVAKIGGWHVNLKTDEVFWTSETYAIHEVGSDYQPRLENKYAFYTPEARSAIQSAEEWAIESGEPWDLKLPLITANGRHIWVRVRGEVEYEDNKPVRLAGAFQDITEEKRLEAEFLLLQCDEYSSRAQLESVIRAATEVSIIATDPNGLITLFSPGAERLLGYSAKEMVGLQTPECFHQAEEVVKRGEELTSSLGRTIERFETFIAPLMQEGYDKREWTYVCKDGSYRTVELTVTAIRNQHELVEGYLGVAIDVTQKKINEKRLDRLASAVSKSTNGVVITDDAGRVEWINDRFVQISGYELEAIQGKTPGSVLQGERSDPDIIEQMRQKIRQGECFEVEIINYHQSGREYWIHIKGDPIYDAEGKLTGYMAIENDITERKLSEQQILESRESIRNLLDALPVAAYTCNNQGLITYYNQTAVEVWGREPALYSPADRFCGSYKLYDVEGLPIPHDQCWMALALERRQIFHGKEVVVENEDGSRKTALAHASPLYNIQGEVTGAVNVLVDISDRIALEKSLKETTARLELCSKVLDQHAIVAETELNGIIRHVNDMFCKVTGFEREEAVGKTHVIVNSGFQTKEFWQNVFKTIASEGIWQGEICNRRKNGELYWVDTTIASMQDGEGKETGYLAIRNDITDLKLAQEAALAASHSKSEFLANMSHEIRTPLTAILGFADLLQDEQNFADSPARRTQAVSTIQEAGNHLLTVINDILDLSKIEAQKMELDYSPTQLFNVLDHTESLLRPRAIEKKVDLQTIIQTPIPDLINSDSTRLRQILMNLVGNAIKFTDQGSIKIIVQKHAPEDGGELLQIDIEDTGPGMSEQQANKTFHAFSQADTSVTRQHGGTGLGLVISRKLARLMGGEVSLAWTELGKGTCFRLVLPIHPLPQTRYQTTRLHDPLENIEKTPTAALAQLPSQTRILLAEDGPDNQRLISFLLTKMGAFVDLADNGAIAYQKIREATASEEPYDLLLTDMQMPEMDGYTLARTLREENATLPIIALTAHAMPEDRQKCIDAGCDDYLSKPVNSKILADTILDWIMRDAETKIEPPSVT
ncbi:MAG: PAS domain S-box protein [Planctomycetes bacterium]|nr:PAS domain S-box protein [Planctomycetota bacterium]MCH9724939.1 PAS domain S-box protein [Planctomycetota bacterium]MCH9776898.1 PAS domain S-box protein [Planctomycetota bacterium]